MIGYQTQEELKMAALTAITLQYGQVRTTCYVH